MATFVLINRTDKKKREWQESKNKIQEFKTLKKKTENQKRNGKLKKNDFFKLKNENSREHKTKTKTNQQNPEN